MMTGPYTDARPVSSGLGVLLPSGASITSTHQATLDLPSLPIAARKCHHFPDLTSGALISIGQLCDYGCIANFTANTGLYNMTGRQCYMVRVLLHQRSHQCPSKCSSLPHTGTTP